jgi:hypothetical protein
MYVLPTGSQPTCVRTLEYLELPVEVLVPVVHTHIIIYMCTGTCTGTVHARVIWNVVVP